MNTKTVLSIVENIFQSLSLLDVGCCWFDILKPKSKNIIYFDNNEREASGGPYLEIKFYPKYAKIYRGNSITDTEKRWFLDILIILR